MNVKKTLFSAFAAVALCASVMTPVAMADSTEDTTQATVKLTNGGSFDIEFCGAVVFDETAITSSTDENLPAGVEICYTDSVPTRSGFRLQLSAGDFTSGSGGTIPASNLTLGTMYNPLQGQWSSIAPGQTTVGDIGAWNGIRQVTDHYGTNTTEGTSPYDPANNTLDQARFIAYSWDGAGTDGSATGGGSNSVPDPNWFDDHGDPNPDSYSSGLISGWGKVEGTYQVFGVNLHVTSGVPAGNYHSTLTLTYIPTAGYP